MRSRRMPTESAAASVAAHTALMTLAVLLLLATLASTAPAAIIIVDHAGGGDYQTIQAGLAAAAEGDTVLVEPGTYSGDGNRDLSFGTKHILLQSSAGSAATIIDLEDAAGHRAINFNGTGQDTTCVIDGFTIFDGRMIASQSNGAGIRCLGASPRIINCRFESNRAAGLRGGAIYLDTMADAVIRNCEFIENIAYTGGAIACDNVSRPKISGCLFQGNEGGDEGGAIYLGFQCDASITGCRFVENTTELHGGTITHKGASGSVSNSVFIRGVGDVAGGALHITDQSLPVLVSCTFFENSASEEGGCIHVNTHSYPTLVQCLFSFTGPCDDSTIFVDGTSGASIMWSCSYANAPGNILPTDPSDYFIADPVYCDLTTDDLTLAANSPCLPNNNLWHLLIGAFGQDCVQSLVEERTWGTIKAMYR